MQAIVNLLVGVFRNADFTLWVRILFELFDFMVKAAIAYRETEQGAKEWDEFASRYEVAVNNGANGNVEYSVTSQAEAGPIGRSASRVDDPNAGRS
jgi:hypothetical protein